MNFKLRTILTCLVCLLVASTAFAQKHRNHPPVSIKGVYGDFTVGKGSGDLEGMRVVIFSAGDAYHAIVQIAEGGAEDPKPQYSEVAVKGTAVEFAVGIQKYSGTVTAAGLKLMNTDGTTRLLKRKPCSTYL